MSLEREQFITLLLAERVLIKNKKGITTINPQWEFRIQFVPKLFYTLRDFCPWTEDSFREQIHCLLNDIVEPPGCRGCGKFVTFNSYRNAYNNYCSRVCPQSQVNSDITTN
jgi:hypothetical protein